MGSGHCFMLDQLTLTVSMGWVWHFQCDCKTLQLLVCGPAPSHNVMPHSCSGSIMGTLLPVFHCREKEWGAGTRAWFSSTCEEVFWWPPGQKPDFSRQHCAAVSHGEPTCMTWAQKPDCLGWNPALLLTYLCLLTCPHNGQVSVLSRQYR